MSRALVAPKVDGGWREWKHAVNPSSQRLVVSEFSGSWFRRTVETSNGVDRPQRMWCRRNRRPRRLTRVKTHKRLTGIDLWRGGRLLGDSRTVKCLPLRHEALPYPSG